MENRIAAEGRIIDIEELLLSPWEAQVGVREELPVGPLVDPLDQGHITCTELGLETLIESRSYGYQRMGREGPPLMVLSAFAGSRSLWPGQEEPHRSTALHGYPLQLQQEWGIQPETGDSTPSATQLPVLVTRPRHMSRPAETQYRDPLAKNVPHEILVRRHWDQVDRRMVDSPIHAGSIDPTTTLAIDEVLDGRGDFDVS
ncbi:hypothetical protein AFLA_001711 [Aspergillus flavus NRRL3357]|nr:hypothetical protein AFLA_001711 [Aspergillus flavus NRRL3357]